MFRARLRARLCRGKEGLHRALIGTSRAITSTRVFLYFSLLFIWRRRFFRALFVPFRFLFVWTIEYRVRPAFFPSCSRSSFVDVPLIFSVQETTYRIGKHSVVVFFTSTDRASTIPSNIRSCQSGTWSAGQKKIRGTSTKLPREQKKNAK